MVDSRWGAFNFSFDILAPCLIILFSRPCVIHLLREPRINSPLTQVMMFTNMTISHHTALATSTLGV